MKKIYFIIYLLTHSIGAQEPVKLGIISDPHLHQIYVSDANKELHTFYNSKTKKFELVRALQGQMESTRLFNENYFAFRQALSNLVDDKVDMILISGDYTDDGQMLNIQAINKLLKEYTQKYNIRFFLTNGNHEAVNSIDKHSGKSDFINQKGEVVGVYSKLELAKTKQDIVYPLMQELGYESMFPIIKDYGFTAQSTDLFYSTPFHAMDYEGYRYIKDSFNLSERTYSIRGEKYVDLTYLVEPIQGIWILSIDGNMYDKITETKYKNISDGYSFIEERAYLIHWINQVVIEAKKRGKKLISFGHYPILDFNNNLSSELSNLLGQGKFQLNRVPSEEIQNLFLNTGMQIHFAGHMHINQHGVKELEQGKLWNIQVPSLAAFPPAYKVVNIDKNSIKIETTELHDVEDFDSLFKLYAKEVGQGKFIDFFEATNYYQLTKSHLKYLSENRFLKSDFSDSKWNVFKNVKNLLPLVNTNYIEAFSAKSSGILNSLDFKTIVFDLYLIRNGNDIGIKEIDKDRLDLYREWSILAENSKSDNPLDQLVVLINKMFKNSLSTQYLQL